jgi:hypothetical protein
LADLVALTRVVGKDFQNPMGSGRVAEKAKIRSNRPVPSPDLSKTDVTFKIIIRSKFNNDLS